MSAPSPPTTAPRPKSSYITALILIPVGLLLAAVSLYFGAQQRTSLDWPAVAGVVVNSYVEEYRDADQSPSYYARVVFQYTVEEEVYASQQVSFGIVKSYASQNGAAKALQAYPVGKMVSVYYDPADPTNAVLERGTSQITPFLWLGGGLTLLGLFALVGAVRARMVES
ncbi:MAG: DUF3592 domain-containing protein [Anaerolineales bacterium]